MSDYENLMCHAGEIKDAIERLAETQLTKRELFAAMAMQGILAAEREGFQIGNRQRIAATAVTQADWLLSELQHESGVFAKTIR
jgi:hypothetical protein